MIPVVGMASTGGKFVVKGSNAIEDAQNASKAADNVKDGAKGRGNLNDPQCPVIPIFLKKANRL